MTITGRGTSRAMTSVWMANDLTAGLLVVLGVLAGIAILLLVLTHLDPTNVRRELPRKATRSL
jgi:hypothetical protein